MNPSSPTIQPEFKFQRTIFIEYENGGDIADALRGKQMSKQFSADMTNPGMDVLLTKINDSLVEQGSNARATDLELHYDVTLTGRGLNTSFDFKVVLVPTFDSYVIRQYSGTSPALIDADWRGIVIDGPVTITTKDGDTEINQPLSFLKESAPKVFDKLSGTKAHDILLRPIMDASGIGKLPITNWHFLFDPTGINVDASQYGLSEEVSGVVVSSFTMGESSIREGRVVEKVIEAEFTLDESYAVRSVESADNANFDVIGFANPSIIEGSEVFGVSPTPPEGYATTSTGEFPVMIIYGMAGMAAIVAVGFFVMSSRKLKSEAGQGQTGIDPSQLRGVATSAGSGGYQTVRGEAQLKDGSDYEQTQSVYEQEKSKETTNDSSSTRGSLPKGWKK